MQEPKKIFTVGSAMRDAFIEYASRIVLPQGCQPCIALEEGKKIEIHTLSYEVGGGALNTAVALQRLGLQAYPIVKIGTDVEGDDLVAKIMREQLSCDYVYRSSSVPTGTSFIIPSPSGNRAVLVYRGASALLENADIPYAMIKNAQGLYSASLNGQASYMLPILAAYAQTHSIPFLINPGTTQLQSTCKTLLDALLYNPFLILNAHEAHLLATAISKTQPAYYTRQEQIFDHDAVVYCQCIPKRTVPQLFTAMLTLESSFTIADFFQMMHTSGVSKVIVTNGADGAYASDGQKIYYHPALATTIVSTIGAGDAFGATFFAYYLMGSPIMHALHAASLNSAAVLTSVGATTALMTKKEIDAQYP